MLGAGKRSGAVVKKKSWEYTVVVSAGDEHDLEKEVSARLNDGWTLHGTIVMESIDRNNPHSSNVVFAQAMVRFS